MEDKRLTLILVPHGDLETRTFEISYRHLKFLLFGGGVLLATFVVIVSLWWYVAAQAARVPGLERELTRLRGERAQVAELARTLAEVEAQYERVRQLLGADAAGKSADTWLPPLRREEEGRGAESGGAAARPTSWPLTQPGYITRELTGGDRARHPGLDIAVSQDSYIRAAGPGVVKDAGRDDVYGYYVLIDHGNGYESMYGHASALFVSAGRRVERNEVIALSGSTGRSTAPHLHFEIRKDGQAVDPLSLVRQP
ncbi:MAG: M23 family metallopeptidase [Gemmatimonadetes bacterium]|nr:M23 family metallopeptidase [Gemmatimonadota bacterium]